MSIDSAFGFQSQDTKALAAIDSTKYPDTNIDFQQNLIRLNQFVDYIASYLQQMQKATNQNNQDPIAQIQGVASDAIVLLGGGELLYGIDLGDLQYFLPAIGALLGFDTTTPFPINLFNAAEHFLLGYVVPLASFSTVIEGIIDGWAEALGIDASWIQAINDLLDALGGLETNIEGLLTALEDLLNIVGGIGPFGQVWHLISILLGGLNLADIGGYLDAAFKAAAPWIEDLAIAVNYLNQIIESFTGGVNNIQGILNFSQMFAPFVNFLNPAFNSLDAIAEWIANGIYPTNLLAPLEAAVGGGFTVPQLNIPGLDASKILSGTFTASFLPAFISRWMSGSNLVINPSFTDPAMWPDIILTGLGLGRVIAHSGGSSAMMTQTSAGWVGVNLFSDDSGVHSLFTQPSDIYEITGWLYPASGNAGTGALQVYMQFIDSTGTNADNFVTQNVLASGLTNSAWNHFQFKYTAPASGYDRMQAAVTLPSGTSNPIPTGDVYYLDDVSVREVTLTQMLIDTITNALGGSGTLNALSTVSNIFNNIFSFIGLPPGLANPVFNEAAAVQNFLTTMLAPANQTANTFATLVSDATQSGGVTGFIPMENLATELIGGGAAAVQQVWDAILASVGIPAGSGTPAQATTYFQNLMNVFTSPSLSGLTTLLGSAIPALDASKIVSGILALAQIPNLPAGQITSGTFLASLIPGLDASKIISGIFPQSMVNITSIPASIVSGILNAANIPTLDASKIVSGVLALAQIPNLPAGQITSGTFLSSLIPGLDASKIISGIFGTAQIPNLPASIINSGIFNAGQIPGLDASKIISGLFPQSMVNGLPAAIASMLTATSPLNAQNLFNQVPTVSLGMLPYSHIGPGNPNLLSMPGFDSSGAIINNPNWTWTNSDGHTTAGCAQATASGILETLVSNTVGVSQGQQLTCSCWVKYTNLVATAGQNALRLNVAGYLGTTPVTTQQVAGIASPSGSAGWTQMTGNWTVPSGIDNIVVQLVVTQAATAGTVLYDDASATKSGLMLGTWMQGISGTVAGDLQSVVDQIFQAAGGSGSNNAITTILTSLKNFPGGNIVSALLPAVIPGLDASKIVTGILGLAQVPNITLAKSTDLQGLNDYVTNTLVGVIGQYTGTSLVQSNSSMNSLYQNLNNAITTLQQMRSQSQATTVSGTSVSIDFSNYANGPLPSTFTTTYSGSGSSALGISSGAAGWNPLNNDGNRTAMAVYNVAPTNTDFQIVRGSMASAPGGSTSGGQPRIGGMARVDNPANPQNYLWARAYCTGFLTYKADLGYTVAGVDTIISSGIALTWSMDISVIAGANGNPRRYQAYSGTQLVFDQIESGTNSMIGAGYRYWGCKTEMKTGSGQAGNPGTIASTSVSDNAPPAVLGSTFRAVRASSTTVSVSGGAAALPANFWDTSNSPASNTYTSPDMTWNGTTGVLTLSVEGTYTVKGGLFISNLPTSAKMNLYVAKNSGSGWVLLDVIASTFADSWSGNSPNVICGASNFYCKAGDQLAIWVSASSTTTIMGDNGGTTSVFSVALSNRSMA